MKLKGVIFDYDGTLVHLNIDFEALRKAVERCLLGYGVDLERLKGLYILEMIDEGAGMISWMEAKETTFSRRVQTTIH